MLNPTPRRTPWTILREYGAARIAVDVCNVVGLALIAYALAVIAGKAW